MRRGSVLGIDPGERWVGVARAHRGSSLALPIGTLDRSRSDLSIAEALRELVGAERIEHLVIGVPLRQDGREDKQAVMFRELGESLAESLGAVCVTQNERFSSALFDAPTTRLGHKARAPGRKSVQRQRRERERSHATAAAKILQRWLDDHAVASDRP